jgi:hypothetical protein
VHGGGGAAVRPPSQRTSGVSGGSLVLGWASGACAGPWTFPRHQQPAEFPVMAVFPVSNFWLSLPEDRPGRQFTAGGWRSATAVGDGLLRVVAFPASSDGGCRVTDGTRWAAGPYQARSGAASSGSLNCTPPNLRGFPVAVPVPVPRGPGVGAGGMYRILSCFKWTLHGSRGAA